jgi:hypothetical protein
MTKKVPNINYLGRSPMRDISANRLRFRKEISVSSGAASVNSEFRPQISRGSRKIINKLSLNRSVTSLNKDASVRELKQKEALVIQY